MCNTSNLTILTSKLYIILICIIPILYLILGIIYRLKNKRKKRKRNLLLDAIVIFIILVSIKFIARFLFSNTCFDCYINNNCKIEETIDNKEKNNNSIEKEINEKNTTTKTSTTTKTTNKTKKTNIVTDYPKPDMEDGEIEDVGNTSNGYKIQKVNGVYYIDGFIMANKTYALPSTYYPKNAHKSAKGVTSQCQSCIDELAYKAYIKMKNDASNLGLNIWNQSGYRPYVTQKALWARYAGCASQELAVTNPSACPKQKDADTYSSRPGNSDHQTGYAFDLNSIDDSFANTKEGKWINDNCWKYGFIIRFPKGKDKETGYKYESWHLRYVGTELAKKLYNDGDWLSMEGYFGITSIYPE